jgi:3-methyladenine DNA glycosylase AlkD
MASTKKKSAGKAPTRSSVTPQVDDVVLRLKQLSNQTIREGMARYAIPSDKALGISVGALRKLGKELGPDHALAQALWATDIYEARLLATFVEDPARVTPAQMDRWCKDFDNWAICDTACFHLFDKTPHAFDKVHKWSGHDGEFQRRAAFALLASLALHDKRADDALFLSCLPLIEKAGDDGRNFVKKGVSWALRGIGRRKSPVLKKVALAAAKRLAASDDATSRWLGKDVLRQL